MQIIPVDYWNGFIRQGMMELKIINFEIFKILEFLTFVIIKNCKISKNYN